MIFEPLANVVMSSGRSFQIRGSTSDKAGLATVSLTGGITGLVPAQRRDRRPGKSATRL